MRYKAIRKIFIFYFLFYLTSCVTPSSSTESTFNIGTDECDKSITGLKKRKMLKADGGNCIVLCDFSSSVDATSLGFVKDRAGEILEKFYSKSTIAYYVITNASATPFFRSEDIAIVDSHKITKSQNARFNKCLSLKMSGTKAELSSALENAVWNRPKATFIIESLENAIKIISVKDPGHFKKNVIFLLSDMKESGTSVLGTFNLDVNAYEQEIANLEAARSVTISPQVLKSIDVRIGFYSSDPKDRNKLERFWRLVFSKLGFPACPPITSQVDTTP